MSAVLAKKVHVIKVISIKHIMQYKKILAVSVDYIIIFSLQQIDQQRNTLINHRHFLPLK